MIKGIFIVFYPNFNGAKSDLKIEEIMKGDEFIGSQPKVVGLRR
jgi:hypothetical protein